MSSKNKRGEKARKWGQIVAKAWTDEKFKKKLLEHPAQTLKEHGLDLGSRVVIHESTKEVVHLALPPRPEDLSDEDLKSYNAASEDSSSCYCC